MKKQSSLESIAMWVVPIAIAMVIIYLIWFSDSPIATIP